MRSCKTTNQAIVWSYKQAVDFITNPLDDDVTGRVVVYFYGLQNHTVDTKSTRCDIIIERIRSFCLSLLMPQTVLYLYPEEVLKSFLEVYLPSPRSSIKVKCSTKHNTANPEGRRKWCSASTPFSRAGKQSPLATLSQSVTENQCSTDVRPMPKFGYLPKAVLVFLPDLQLGCWNDVHCVDFHR